MPALHAAADGATGIVTTWEFQLLNTPVPDAAAGV